MSRETARRVGVLACLYVAQGLPFGLFTQALPVMMRQAGHSLEAIGLSNLLALPWALKFAWAPAVDRVAGARSRVIVPLNVAAAGLLAALAMVSPGATGPLLAVVLGCNFLAATQDIATDGYAVELLPEAERGLGNGVQVAGYRLGMVIGGGVLVTWFDVHGWKATFLLAAAGVFAATIPMFGAPAAPRLPATQPGSATDALRWDRWFAGREGFAWFALCFLYKFGESLGSGMVKPMLVDQGHSLGQIGQWVGLYGSIGGMAGALLGGALVLRTDRRSALTAFAVLQLTSLLAYAALASLPATPVQTAIVLEHFCSGMATAGLFTVMMDACRPGHAGMDYTVQASVVVLAQGLAGVLGGVSAAHLGYFHHFLLATAVAALAVVAVRRVGEGSERFRLRAVGGAGRRAGPAGNLFPDG